MKGKIASLGWVLFGIATIFIFVQSTTADDIEEDPHLKLFRDHYKIFALQSPDKLDFCGEEVPVHLSDIRERIDRELLVNTYWQSQGLLFLKRSSKWFPTIEKILREEKVPEDFKYLALIESGLTNVVSPKKATGYWQIMRATGREYGMEINDEVDERYHVEKATRMACSYLRKAKEELGSWTLAAASYNVGKTGLKDQIDIQKVTNYYDLLLNEETSRYVPRILAAKEIFSNPESYGFYVRDKDLYKMPEIKYVEVTGAVSNWADFATKHGINYKILKIFNPWLRKPYLNNTKKKTYKIAIPLSGYESLSTPEK